MIVSVTRAPLRLLIMALIAVPMLLLALDMTVTYRFFPAPVTTPVVVGTQEDPETGDTVEVFEDVLTRDGAAQKRREVSLAVFLALGGAALIAWAAKDLVAPKRLLEADEAGLTLDITSRREPPVKVPWSDVLDIRSGTIVDDGGEVRALVVRLADRSIVPDRPYGAVVDGDVVRLYADEWDQSPQDVAAALSLRVDRTHGTGEVALP